MKKSFSCSLIAASLAGTMLLGGCSSTNNTTAPNAAASRTALSNKIDLARIPDWKGYGGEGAYICDGKPSCPNLAVVVYQANPARQVELNSLRNIEQNPEAALAQLKLGFALMGGGSTGSVAPDGPMEAITVGAIKGAAVPLTGKKANGVQRDPGFMIMLPGKRKIHVFVGISKTKPEAKKAATSVSNAWHQ